MAGVSASRSAAPDSRRAAPRTRDDAADGPGQGPLHKLLNRASALDQLVADAGPLGKFKTDAPDRMPSGTSSLTLKVGDALNRLAARLGMPQERILSGNPSRTPELKQAAPAELPPGHGPAAADRGARVHDIRPAIAADTDNRVRAHHRGNPVAPDA